MSDKSRDAEPTPEEVVPGDPDAAEIYDELPPEGEVEIDDRAALAEAEADVMDMDDDETIGEMEKQFDSTDDTVAATPAIVRKTAKAPVRKTEPTKRRKDAVADHEDHYRAGNPVEFAKQSGAELKKVVWPTWPQLVTMFFAVLVFVLIIIAIVGGLDVLFGWILLSLFGN